MTHARLMRFFLCISLFSFESSYSQEVVPIDDWKPASTNQEGKDYPQVNSEGRVKFRVVAPDAKSVSCSFRDSSEFTKDEKGAWTGFTRPLDEGFHYYTLKIDGAEVPDPNSKYFFGAMRWGSGVEVPAKDRDFYALKNVPHGQLREVLFYSSSTDSTRRAFIYTPPGYDNNSEQRYPVLYLQHGWGENEYGWSVQGHANLIMDNLIAEGKIKPFIIVMTYGMTNEVRMGGIANFDISHFEKVLVDELIPYVDSNFRTLTDQPNRAMAGLSMGSMETKLITLKHVDKFSHIGLFSGATIGKEDAAKIEGFKDRVKLVFVSYGSKEVGSGSQPRRGGDPEETTKLLKEFGINSWYYLSPDTAHEWQTWRRSLKEFAPLLFQPEEKLSGTWHSRFDTPMGMQTYHFEFASYDGKAIAKAAVETIDQKRNVEFKDVKLDGAMISFVELLKFGDREMRINYTGTLEGQKIHFVRAFAGRGSQEAIATRQLPMMVQEVNTAPVVQVKIDKIVKDAFQESFLVGFAGDLPIGYSDAEIELAATHFNAITPENCMKPERIHPNEGMWQFDRPDALCDWANKNRMAIHGHTLVWHQQTPSWFFEGNDREVILQRLKEHIETVVGRYRGKVASWDVVNEAIADGGNAETGKTENLRNSKWLETLGTDFLTLAFRYAHEADPNAVLYYNDYNIESGSKHESSMQLLRRMLAEGSPVHAVGIQGHWRVGQVPFEDIDKAITDYSSLGLKVSITELDVTIGGESGGQFGPRGGSPRSSGRPVVTERELREQADAYARLFAIFKKHERVIDRITFWGLNDRRTWRWGQHPLLFDANNNPKPAYVAIVDESKNASPTESDDSEKTITIENGGQGPHAAIVTEDPSQAGITIYRPKDLSEFGGENKLPVLLWGNGACANTTEEHKNFLNEIASHGYIVLGIGLLDQIESRDERSRNRTQSSQLLAALDWITEENSRSASKYFGKVSTSSVAAMGMSCGGLQAIEISGDPRIKTTVVCNSGVLASPSTMPAMPKLTKEDLKKLHAPVLYIMGGPSDIAYKNAMDDFTRLEHVPVVMTNLDVGHGGTYRQPHGGDYSPVAIAWLEWQLKAKKDAAKMFQGEDCRLKQDTKWTIETKNLEPRPN